MTDNELPTTIPVSWRGELREVRLGRGYNGPVGDVGDVSLYSHQKKWLAFTADIPGEIINGADDGSLSDVSSAYCATAQDALDDLARKLDALVAWVAAVGRKGEAPLPPVKPSMQLDPGITRVVAWLREQGFDATDSDDGVCVRVQDPRMLPEETSRLQRAIFARDIELLVEASYDPFGGLAVIRLPGLDDALLARHS